MRACLYLIKYTSTSRNQAYNMILSLNKRFLCTLETFKRYWHMVKLELQLSRVSLCRADLVVCSLSTPFVPGITPSQAFYQLLERIKLNGNYFGSNGYWTKCELFLTKWILEQMGIGPNGYCAKWVQDQIGIRPNSYQPQQVLD